MATWRLWPSTNGGTLVADPNPYSASVEFEVTQSGCTLTGYYFWCPASGATNALSCTLWSCTTGTTGTQITGANATTGTLTAGAWNFVACTATALTSGQHYRAEVTHSQSSSWYSATASYWTSGAGSAGITNGPITAFSSAAALGNNQCGFIAGGTPAYTNNTSGNPNYWIDVQVDDGGAAVTATAHPAVPGRTWLRRFRHRQAPILPTPTVLTITGTANLAGAGSVAAGKAAYPAIPGVAVPGHFTPGNPAASPMVTAAPQTRPAAAQAALPGLTWVRRFRRRQQVLPQVPAGPVTTAATANLAGAGSVTAVVTEAPIATAAGAGAVTNVITEGVTAAAAGAGSVNGLVTLPGGGTITGAGAVGTAVTQGVIASAAGAGAVTDVVTQIVTAGLTGAGSVTANVAGAGSTANLTGAGAVTAVATVIAPATAAGAGAVAAVATQAVKATAAAAGSVNASGQITGTASLTGTGSVTAKAAQAVTAAPAGAGALAALTRQAAAAALTGAGSVTATGGTQLAFTVGTLTPSDAPAGVLTTATAPGGSGGVLTASDTRTGGPG